MPILKRIPSFIPVLMLSIAMGCASKPSGPVFHMVVIWLKDPGNAEHRKRIIDETRKMKSIPGIESLSVGPCIKSSRSIVDSSFDVAITMTFASKAAMNEYLKHPAHVSVVKTKLMPMVDKILVYDFVDATI